MSAYIVDWMSLLIRWLHVITGIAWIGASFYFVWLDNHLKPVAADVAKRRGVHGDLWAVHGGGFYHSEKFLLGPQDRELPAQLHWFKWEAYWTWISGMLLLGLVYWYGATSFLIDSSVAALSPVAGIAISVAVIALGWLIYDAVCRTITHELALGAIIVVFVLFLDWLLFQLFSARAAFIHVGAVLGTIMVANVLFVIIPGQQQMVAAIRAGKPPDPRPGIQGKQRSVHNTYFTLPVLFIMISSHYPMTYGHSYGWLVLAGILCAGVLIRVYFVQRHTGKNRPVLFIAGLLLLAVIAVVIRPASLQERTGVAELDPVTTADIVPVIQQHCTSCHSERTTDVVFLAAPMGVMFDTVDQIEALAPKIYQRTVVSKDMPLANNTSMTEDERALIGAWYAGR
ncbi:MAG: urate hydroxylase PuuD [Gammaproteobacteria bacterium]|nr:urate hydroxylase PuuD [Gammaproteobacteria bacterium]